MSEAAGATIRPADVAIGAGLLAGTANVIMQLARPGVGYGVVESRVDSGNLFKHPVKRTRTTLSYLAVTLLGTDEERRRYARAVTRSHARVRSTETSPVSYNAFDPELQLWVAACLYRGFQDTFSLFGSPVEAADWERLYRELAVFGETLQVPAHRWPADTEAFERYWKESLDQVEIDDTVRAYLTDLILLKPFAPPVQLLFRDLNRFVTTGFLTARFREEMRLSWDEARQRRFDRLMRLVRLLVRAAPPRLRAFPFNLVMVDLRWRIRTGRALV
ncbi:MAG TPA: oxygenase MpaB family protein [Pseudonocardia sp.]|jgi:uncharacterized protein (DUF2236 family)|uniref:oxygenase MpaB family protein n=1 Tax=Pseudonocardia sp. TaxID=60912 RepID=UPI002F3EB00A